MACTVTFNNNSHQNGVNIDYRLGPDNGQQGADNFPAHEARLNYQQSLTDNVLDGYIVWWRIDADPDSPTIPPTYRDYWDKESNLDNMTPIVVNT